jgi:hypothetical protein
MELGLSGVVVGVGYMYVFGERTVWEKEWLSRSCSKERFTLSACVVLAPPMVLATARPATGLMSRIYGKQLMR